MNRRAAVVGPVLARGVRSDAIVVAIRRENPAAHVVDRGGYLRVTAPAPCRVTRTAIEEALGAPFRLPADLEELMTAFSGRFRVDEDEALWYAVEGGA